MDHTEMLQFGGHEIRVAVKELNGNGMRAIKNWLPGGGGISDRSLNGNLEDVTTREAIAALYVDNKQRPIMRRNAATGVEELDIPVIKDDEQKMFLDTKLLYLIVKHNDFLGFWEPYNVYFSTYLPKEDLESGGEPKENPTAIQAG